MKKYVTIIGICLLIVPALCCAQDWQQKTPTDCDSCTVLTPNEVRQANRVYDDREECYQQYVAAVELADRWRQRFDIQFKQHQLLHQEMKTRQQVQQLTDAEFEKFQKEVLKLQRALKRNKTLVWILAGYGVASTAVAAFFIASK